MRLADFIERNTPAILAEWEAFAASLMPAATGMDAAGLRDHAEQILKAIVKDLRTPQTSVEQKTKSKGGAVALRSAPETAAQTHAVLRAVGGFTIQQLVGEYRALRASVLHLWGAAHPHSTEVMDDAGRFNEAIDQAIAESVDYFSREVDRWRAVFLGVLGHDLRGPLNAVLVTAKVLSAMSLEPVTSEHAKRLIRSGERMKQLLDDLLDYSRMSLDVGIPVSLAPGDLEAPCREEIELLRVALDGVSVDFNATGNTQGHWDASRIRQIVSNLVTNAARYGDRSHAILVRLHGGDDEVSLSVENRGPSIPSETLPSLFEPMRRGADPNLYTERENLGLGLFIVRQVAFAHGGEVSAESAGGRTVFTVVLPKRQ